MINKDYFDWYHKFSFLSTKLIKCGMEIFLMMALDMTRGVVHMIDMPEEIKYILAEGMDTPIL